MRKPTEDEAGFGRAIRRELDKLNLDESAKEHACTFTPLQAHLIEALAVQMLVEMHDAQAAEKAVADWREKSSEGKVT